MGLAGAASAGIGGLIHNDPVAEIGKNMVSANQAPYTDLVNRVTHPMDTPAFSYAKDPSAPVKTVAPVAPTAGGAAPATASEPSMFSQSPSSFADLSKPSAPVAKPSMFSQSPAAFASLGGPATSAPSSSTATSPGGAFNPLAEVRKATPAQSGPTQEQIARFNVAAGNGAGAHWNPKSSADQKNMAQMLAANPTNSTGVKDSMNTMSTAQRKQQAGNKVYA